ncbi:MAG TPA: glycosyltransferase family 2 protein [Gaiellaceae bacterium]|nr:glycosyltransferase family 2 protein [Gaiellaceae bacterium]
MSSAISVVIPAHNAGRTIGMSLRHLQDELWPDDELFVVDDGSTDDTASLAQSLGACVIPTGTSGSVGNARNLGWNAATRPHVVFLDADAIVEPGWRQGVARATDEFAGSAVGCARGLVGRNAWSWVAQLQVGTPWLATGSPRPARTLPSFCLVVPRELPVRWDVTFGGEDGLFAADLLSCGVTLVFDPRFAARHEEYRDTFAQVRTWHRRLVYGMARCGPVQREGRYKRMLTRVPVHFFLLARLPRMYMRLRKDAAARRLFLRLLPWMIVAEWSLGVAALRYAASRRPPLRTASRVSAAS